MIFPFFGSTSLGIVEFFRNLPMYVISTSEYLIHHFCIAKCKYTLTQEIYMYIYRQGRQDWDTNLPYISEIIKETTQFSNNTFHSYLCPILHTIKLVSLLLLRYWYDKAVLYNMYMHELILFHDTVLSIIMFLKLCCFYKEP